MWRYKPSHLKSYTRAHSATVHNENVGPNNYPVTPMGSPEASFSHLKAAAADEHSVLAVKLQHKSAPVESIIHVPNARVYRGLRNSTRQKLAYYQSRQSTPQLHTESTVIDVLRMPPPPPGRNPTLERLKKHRDDFIAAKRATLAQRRRELMEQCKSDEESLDDIVDAIEFEEAQQTETFVTPPWFNEGWIDVDEVPDNFFD